MIVFSGARKVVVKRREEKKGAGAGAEEYK
jgi:hypothetical protein